MIQKIHPWGVIWVPSSRLMWADQRKKLTAVPSLYKEVHVQLMKPFYNPPFSKVKHCAL